MAQQTASSVLPIYSIGIVWILHSLLFPLYTLPQYLLCTLESLIAFVIVRALCQRKGAKTGESARSKTGGAGARTTSTGKAAEPKKEEEKPASTGNPEIDALLQERTRAVSEMRRLNEAIEDEKISSQIDHLETVTSRIIDEVAKNPKKLPQIRRFMDYYLPTTLKILNVYDRMGAAGVSGSNINATKEKVERMMDTVVQAYDKQLDALFGEEALDISTDITVMEQLLAREGFGSSNSGAQTAEGSGGGIRLEL